MPWTQKQMLRDANGDLIPQYWDVVRQEFRPLTGRDGANDVRITGRNVDELVKRSVRNSDSINNIIQIPQCVKNVTFIISIFGVTGTFADGEGLSFRIFEISSTSYLGIREVTRIETSRYVNASQFVLSTYAKPPKYVSSKEFIGLDRPLLTNILRWDLLISGKFGAGEGFDVEVYAHWS